MIKIKKKTFCPVCASKKISKVLKLKDIPFADNFSKSLIKTKHDKLYPIHIMLCASCSHLFLNHFIDHNNYYKNKFSYKTQVTQELKKHFNNEIKIILNENKVVRNSFCLDIGSNDGTILSIFKKNKMEFLGIEPSIKIANYANRNGLKTLNCFFDNKIVNKIKSQYGRPKVITSTYTFANIENTKNFLKNIKNLIHPKGIFVIETGYHPRQMENNMFDYFYHEHFSYFCFKSLKILLNNSGFKVIKVKVTEPKSGSIIVVSKKVETICDLKSSYKFEKKFMVKEKKIGIYTSLFYKKFHKKIINYKKKLHLHLNSLKKRGERIVGYGASHSSTLLLHQFELNKFFDFLVDDNKIKHKTFSPNYKIPVLSSSEIYKQKIKTVVLLAWNKKKYILKKHKKFLSQQGNFILPF